MTEKMFTLLFCFALFVACCGVGLLTIWLADMIENKENKERKK